MHSQTNNKREHSHDTNVKHKLGQQSVSGWSCVVEGLSPHDMIGLFTGHSNPHPGPTDVPPGGGGGGYTHATSLANSSQYC